MKRSGPLRRGKGLRRGKALRSASLKMTARRLNERAERTEYLARHPRCEAGPILKAAVPQWRCDGFSVDVHERKKRSRGGSTTDEATIMALCRRCHDFTENFPEHSTRLGLLVPSWADVDDVPVGGYRLRDLPRDQGAAP